MKAYHIGPDSSGGVQQGRDGMAKSSSKIPCGQGLAASIARCLGYGDCPASRFWLLAILLLCLSMPKGLGQIMSDVRVYVDDPDGQPAEIYNSPVADKLFVNLTRFAGLNNRPRTIFNQAPAANVVNQDPDNWLEMKNTLGPNRSILLSHAVDQIVLGGQGSATVVTDVDDWTVSYTVQDHGGGAVSLVGEVMDNRNGRMFSFDTGNVFLNPAKKGRAVDQSQPGQDTLPGSASIERFLQQDGTYDLKIEIHALPEPESYAMAMGGLGVGWGVWRRWRRRVA